jgi:hypothetical protein
MPEIDILQAPPVAQTLVVVGVPTRGMVSIQWHSHMSQLQVMNFRTRHVYIDGCEVGVARNHIVRQALDGGASHVFFVDDDVLIPPDALLRLLAHKRPIVSGLYYAKTATPQPLVMNDAFCGVDTDWTEGDLVECASHGMGCTLIAREVFEAIEAPWYQTTNVTEGATKVHQTEDAYFCRKAREAGYQPAVDTGLFCPHWASEERRWYPLDRFEAARREVA